MKHFIKAIEIWIPSNDRLIFSDGYSIGDLDLKELHKETKYKKGNQS